jgi:translation elongation factor EF-Ts
MEYTLKDIQRLRKITGAGPLECKEALQAARSFEEAVTTVEPTGKKRVESILLFRLT